MTYLKKNPNGCPYLFLAPMEGLGDSTFRKAMSQVGGFNECVTEFIRVPTNAHVKSLAKVYCSQETYPIPQAAQIMGSDPGLMAAMAIEMEKRGAPRVDLNCGCPSNTVTGRGAGSSLLKDPNSLHRIAKEMVNAVSIPVTVKMRTGYEDTSLFKENILAAQESGIQFLTLHPRTKVDGYGPPAKWEFIALAKSLLTIPLVGNGDILSVADAMRMQRETRCDALMIGRGAVTNPFIFHELQAHYSGGDCNPGWEKFSRYFTSYIEAFPIDMPEKTRVNKCKQMLGFLFRYNKNLLEKRQAMLSITEKTLEPFLAQALPLLKSGWE